MSDPVVQLSDPPKPDTAVTKALTVGVASGVAAGKVVSDAAVNGLQGWAKVAANITGVGIVFLLALLMYRDSAAAQREERQMFREALREQRETDSRLREAANAELRGFATEFRAGMAEFRGLIRDLRGPQR